MVQLALRHRNTTFEAKDFVRTSPVLTAIALSLVMPLGAPRWRWLGDIRAWYLDSAT